MASLWPHKRRRGRSNAFITRFVCPIMRAWTGGTLVRSPLLDMKVQLLSSQTFFFFVFFVVATSTVSTKNRQHSRKRKRTTSAATSCFAERAEYDLKPSSAAGPFPSACSSFVPLSRRSSRMMHASVEQQILSMVERAGRHGVTISEIEQCLGSSFAHVTSKGGLPKCLGAHNHIYLLVPRTSYLLAHWYF